MSPDDEEGGSCLMKGRLSSVLVRSITSSTLRPRGSFTPVRPVASRAAFPDNFFSAGSPLSTNSAIGDGGGCASGGDSGFSVRVVVVPPSFFCLSTFLPGVMGTSSPAMIVGGLAMVTGGVLIFGAVA